jgi:hypothetical protein
VESTFSDTEYQRLQEASAWKKAILDLEGELVAARCAVDTTFHMRQPEAHRSDQHHHTMLLTSCTALIRQCGAFHLGLQCEEYSRAPQNASEDPDD